jgi:quinol monooxygenase YgiN
MLILTGPFELAPEDRDAFLASRVEGMRTSRAEQGCLAYVFSADPLEPGRVLLFEQWETEEDLAAHAAAMQAARKAAPPKPADAPPSPKVLSSSILKHVVASSGPLF